MPETTTLSLTGRQSDTRQLPALLQPARRTAGEPDDPFLPPGFLQTRVSFEVGAAVRGTGARAQEYQAASDEVLVIELADGGVLITSAGKLKAALERSRPELIGSHGEILFDRLRSEGAAARGVVGEAIGGLVSRVFALTLGASGDPILDAAREKHAELSRGRVGKASDLGVTWLGTKALMWAIEKRLDRQPGLYCWDSGRSRSDGGSDKEALDRARRELQRAVDQQLPVLVFVHGTASSTLGSFGDLQLDQRDVWQVLERHYAGGIYAFEHRTLSESPIENALQLLAALPAGVQLSLVSHSRGGLVADLICLDKVNDRLIEQFRSDLPGTGDADAAEAQGVRGQLESAHAEQREQLRQLAGELAAKKLQVRRYVRVASPAQGTRLASGNLDLFLSGVLTLIGQVPFFFGSPFYSAFKRVVLEIARNRTNAHLVPGIEAMLPDSPMARLLRDAPVRAGIEMAVIAGDIEGGNLLKRLGVLLTDFLLFDNVDNDLVVDTASMFGGIASQAGARTLFDRGADVSHFRYFSNIDTRGALRDWLVAREVLPLTAFQPLPGRFEDLEAATGDEQVAGVSRGADDRTANLPVVVVLPGVMGSHLAVGGKDRVWFDPLDIASGGLGKIAWEKSGIEAEKLFDMFYSDICKYLSTSHRVERFAYDWRQPLDVLAERCADFLEGLLSETTQPVRLLAHSMGGLVIRACIHKRRAVVDQLMARDGARLVMLGTPNQGAYSMVENLLGKGDTLRSLVRLDVTHDMQEVLQIVSGFRGALQLLPKPGFVDTFQGQPGGGDPGQRFDFAETWKAYQPKVFDFWFGNGKSATPDQQQLDAANWLWRQDGEATPALPEEYKGKTTYVFGVARNTPCGIREENGRLKMVGTTLGDGTVTWSSGRIDNVGSYYYLPAKHGDLPSTREYFPALAELLRSGATSALLSSPPSVRDGEQARPVVYDAGPPTLDGGEAVARGLLGGSPRSRVAARAKRRLEVSVKAMDLRFLTKPVLLGHYEQDSIAGAEALIDRELLAGDLGQRYNLGLYAGPRGAATVVLRAPTEQERRRGSLSGAVVTGLGAYDGNLSVADLTEAVRTGVLRYLLQVVDVLGKDTRELPLATLLLGYNSSANLTVAASVEALLRGVMEANSRFHETTRLDIRVSRLEIVELYQDTAITAAYALRQMPERLADLTRRYGVALICRPQLEEGQGLRRRLFDSGNPSYWPRLMVTDAATDHLSASGSSAARTAGGRPVAPRPRTAIAERLRFLYVGQRARAESVVQQRQPGLVEMLLRQQIHCAVWQEDFGRVLFQLLVPHDFKDAARQLERIVLVVDDYTANLPWELMFADDQRAGGESLPLALRTPVVRQLAAGQFRRQVRQGLQRKAFVVGNPSVEGFVAAFPDPQRPNAINPPALPWAEREAYEVAGVLQGLGYQVVAEIGSDRRACDVLTRLYQQPYRVLHISAHGIFDQLHADERRRTGVVLSDGLLITAAEIEAMETVPELVFLSCCHLGKVDGAADDSGERTVRDGNRLAASIARELINIGVRCVVVAGWAVDDQGAMIFGKAFYQSLLLEGHAFGQAVYEARRAVWNANREDITWGAYQAYGDPGWLAEPRLPGGRRDQAGYAAPDELLDELASRRASLSRAKERQTQREIDAEVQSLERLLKERCPAEWQRLSAVQSALAALWADLGDYPRAHAAYVAAVQAEDGRGQVPIRDIEQLANIEALMGEMAEAEPGGALIDSALARLRGLDTLVAAVADGDHGAARTVNAERCALRGSAAKRKASLFAREVLRKGKSRTEINQAAKEMKRALQESADFYGTGEGRPGEPDFRPYNALNRLALEALLLPPEGERQAAIDLARHAGRAASDAFERSASPWDAVMESEALLVERLLDRRLLADGDAGAAVFDELARAYRERLSHLSIKPRELDSVAAQVCLLSRFCDARQLASGDPGWQRAADRLIALAEQIRPGACQRLDRPLREPADEATAAGPVGPGRRRATRKS
ncbi:CHAT domain-containing protein [Accumulibacter sp.]|uniref:CHAT domain-containing protein n=1 Tax=Accumulibacter sp. TaxID=2053492 RepID=UPI00261735E9|nr:CHAT domain-containing protein [Accumulibacter sp.]